MISTLGLSIKALKKEPFSGSHCGMRYYLTLTDERLTVYLYPEPWCFEATPEDQKERNDFPFTQEGLDEAVVWMNERFEAERERFSP
ncbi:GNAT family acetyltransferase [Sporofaciens sp. JLR.KK001]|uniref:GNAT family acetyltransferase n=1 Tax=Sporofaciens sp. JLR.KK001 TaxID=3112621 RepID=UPI002FF278DA